MSFADAVLGGRHVWSLGRTAYILAREGVFAEIEGHLAPPLLRLPLALAALIARRGTDPKRDHLVAAIARLGPSYVKLGQFLATRPDVVSPELVLSLGALQDRMAPFGRETAVETIETAFGRPLDSLFTSFGEPIAAASVAQVHRARVEDATGTRDVAVKVVRPGIEARFRRDLAGMFFAARMAERLVPDLRRLQLVSVVETLARSVRMEMDFRLEAAAGSEYEENTSPDADFHVPKVDWDRTAKGVLTLEWIDGIPLSDIGAIEAAGHDRPALARTLVQSFLRHALRDGFFHADMHQGNLFVDADGRLVAVDFGIMGRLGPKERRFLAEILFGFITRDYLRVARVHIEAGYVPATHGIEDFAQAIRAIGEPIHARTADQISMARLLTLLFEITALFDMKTRVELVMLQKTMVVVEGVARNLDPRLDLWSTSEPVVRGWIEGNLGPVGLAQDLGRALMGLTHAVKGLPATLEKANAFAARADAEAAAGITLSAASVEAIGRSIGRRTWAATLALWVIALAGLIFALRY